MSLLVVYLISDDVAKFKEVITSVLNSLPYPNITEYANLSPSQTDHFVDSASGSMRTTFDSIAPLKQKIIKQRRLAPWFNPQTHILKRTT